VLLLLLLAILLPLHFALHLFLLLFFIPVVVITQIIKFHISPLKAFLADKSPIAVFIGVPLPLRLL
jgi:hypothetical protein